MPKKKNEITIHSSAAEYLTYIAATGDNPEAIEVRYEDENIWLTQNMIKQQSCCIGNENFAGNKFLSFFVEKC